mmetsp:Transcript_21737/g.50447  ORF Transcript_21737/g.50447 Transcript_21737/m.50447 type:complete len:213 (+) Transcript_21737:1854-2492(+)
MMPMDPESRRGSRPLQSTGWVLTLPPAEEPSKEDLYRWVGVPADFLAKLGLYVVGGLCCALSGEGGPVVPALHDEVEFSGHFELPLTALLSTLSLLLPNDPPFRSVPLSAWRSILTPGPYSEMADESLSRCSWPRGDQLPRSSSCPSRAVPGRSGFDGAWMGSSCGGRPPLRPPWLKSALDGLLPSRWRRMLFTICSYFSFACPLFGVSVGL